MNVTWYPPEIPFLNNSNTFMVRRIYCIGRNYHAHAIEMGDKLGEPFYFCKTSDCVTSCASPTTIPYPKGTQDLHPEVELVVAIGQRSEETASAKVSNLVVGYAVGIDFTRRDRQAEAKARRRPWTAGKNFTNAAVVSALHQSTNVLEFGEGRIELQVNGRVRQRANLSQMIWSLPEILLRLETLNTLAPGDLIFTGTPAGVSAVQPGDQLTATIEGLPSLHISIGAPLITPT